MSKLKKNQIQKKGEYNGFKAIIINKDGENFTREVKEIDQSFLKHGNVLVKIDYSSLNYKDGMILKNGGSLVKEYPNVPGIDFLEQLKK